MIQSQLRNCIFRPRANSVSHFDPDQMEGLGHKNRRRVPFISFFSCIPRECLQALFIIPIMLKLNTDPMYVF